MENVIKVMPNKIGMIRNSRFIIYLFILYQIFKSKKPSVHPLRPLVATPSMKYLWPKKNTIKTGNKTIVDAAIIR